MDIGRRYYDMGRIGDVLNKLRQERWCTTSTWAVVVVFCLEIDMIYGVMT